MALNMQTSIDAQNASPALRGFELNPFRVLHLQSGLSASDAILQAENALTLKRVGLAPDEPDMLPWRPEPALYDLQAASQSVEEPFVRLKMQLLWFDFARDPHGAVLAQAMQTPSSAALAEYLTSQAQAASSDDNAPDLGAVAHEINQANLRLLLSASFLSGVLDPTAPGTQPAIKLSGEQWQTLQGFKILRHVHARLQPDDSGGSHARTQWADGLKRWAKLLASPAFRAYVEACIRDLEDEFVTADDVDTICESLRIHLIDVSVQEIRFLLLEGRYASAKWLITALAEAGFAPALVTPAMRPLRQIFQLELSELEARFENQSSENLAALEDHLDHLNLIRTRWKGLDSGDIIGLLDLLDQAVETVYLRLRTISNDKGQVEPLLAKTRTTASAQSLRERIATYEKELEVAKTRLCHFCKTAEPDYEQSVVLRGKKETHREYLGGSTRIHYALRWAIVLRCGDCGKRHVYIRRSAAVAVAALLPLLILAGFMLYSSMYPHTSSYYYSRRNDPTFFVVMGSIFGLYGFVRGGHYLLSELIAAFVTPWQHASLRNMKKTEAYLSLRREFFNDIKPDWRTDAIARLKKERG